MPSSPPPSPLQRAHRAPVTPFRRHAALSPAHHARLAARLTPRDRWLIAMLHEHRVLTTHAIATMAFPSGRAARMRLLQLYQWDVIDRFQPLLRVGAAPMHYVLAGAGAAVLAAQAGVTLKQLGYRRDDALALAHHHTLAHTVAINDLFARLVARSASGPVRLDTWWSETRCRRLIGDIVRPDAYGRVTLARTHTGTHTGRRSGFEWFLELDNATTTLATLAAKIDRYAELAATTHTATPLLVRFPTPRRETGAREHLARALRALDNPALIPLATAATDGTDAGDAAWLPLDPTTGTRPPQRLTLTDLATRWPAPPRGNPALNHPAGLDESP
ncbi:replication-relaxation family protein [Pseudonocardia sp.]|uniref:replication-relaxation family protein n=1 Tax=Pseudonocardia sp. TaxID=60912 RepID=UPI003D12DDEF